MSLRARIATVVATTVIVALAVLGVALQAVTAAVLVGAVDDDLRAIAGTVEQDPRGLIALTAPGRDRLGGAAGIVQVVDVDGTVQRIRRPVGQRSEEGGVQLPVDADVLAVARGELASSLATVDVDGVSVRMLAVPFGQRLALQVARPIDEVEVVVARVRLATLVAAGLGALLAALVAWRIAGRSIRPVTVLTDAVEGVRDGADLAQRSAVLAAVLPAGRGEGRDDDEAEGRGDGRADDEVARLARAFDAMLGRLDASRLAQEQLAADAAHELRTPLTSLRTDVEVLAAGAERLDPADRARLSADVLGQLDELAAMVDGLVLIARVDGARSEGAPVDLAALAADALDAARRRHPRRADDLASDLTSDLVPDRPTVVHGDARELTLAVGALLDNAVKHAPTGTVSVGVDGADAPGGTVRVRVADEGPGVAASDLPHLFERFYRTAEARGLPGAGLGLALVARVAAAHGGRASATLRTPRGLEVTIELPSIEPPAAQPASRPS